jgi:hypothetical protein
LITVEKKLKPVKKDRQSATNQVSYAPIGDAAKKLNAWKNQGA